MSGWGTNPAPSPAWEGNTAVADWTSEAAPATAPSQPDNAAFNTSDMSKALPSGKIGQPQSDGTAGAAATSPGDGTANGWVTPKEYDYGEYATNDGQFDGNATVYHWDGEEGDIGPEFPELEAELFGPPERRELPQGIDFTKIEMVHLEQEGPVRIAPIKSFEDAGLHPAMAKNVELAQYKVPTPIQKYCIPAITAGHDVIGIAQTGSGKTAAYLIPILNKLMGKAKKLAAPRPNPATHRPGFDPPVRAEPLVCVVVPTRELAIQIFMEARKFCYRSMLRPCVVYGGGPIRDQIDQLSKGCDILIASPGRLLDFIDRPQVLTLRRLRYMVIDEADEMLHDDWKEDFDKILGGGEQEEGNIQYMLFSATFPKRLRELAMTHLATEHVRFRVGRAGIANEQIRQVIISTDPSMKRQCLMDLLNSTPPARTIIFVNNKRVADELDDFMFNQGLPCTSIHADRTQREREDAMRSFRAGSSPILIATGVTARGIDVRNVCHVINYDLPSMDHGGIEEYTHRIGRTGRIGHTGLATSFYTERDEPIASVLVRTMMETNQAIPEFLKQFEPEGEDRQNLKFESEDQLDSAFGMGDDSGGAWGGGGGEASGDAWGSGGGGGESAGNAWGGGDAAGAAAGGGWGAEGASGSGGW
ncbi:hypothetical protein VMCG_01907 [Cytospora schulzeri]|uniref:RNA helicase n=1 Tax=Cytospora schulzeri TaxID=448051 RepID=A0A423X3W8_9PEZI|nr:hypothetical protein VMCG_01907 [Valsa malicola]